jgi:hypothetical protein
MVRSKDGPCKFGGPVPHFCLHPFYTPSKKNLNGLYDGQWPRCTARLPRPLFSLILAMSLRRSIMAEQSERLGPRNNPGAWRQNFARTGVSRPESCDSLVGSDSNSCGRHDMNYEKEEEEGTRAPPVTRRGRYLRILPAVFFRSAEAKMQTDAGSQAAASRGSNQHI